MSQEDAWNENSIKLAKATEVILNIILLLCFYSNKKFVLGTL